MLTDSKKGSRTMEEDVLDTNNFIYLLAIAIDKMMPT